MGQHARWKASKLNRAVYGEKVSAELVRSGAPLCAFDLRICKDDLTGHHTPYRGSAFMHCMDQVLLSIARTTSATEAVRKTVASFRCSRRLNVR
jgi:hypothetical protein